VADHATPVPIDGRGQGMPISTMDLSGALGRNAVSSKDVDLIGNEGHVNGIATEPGITGDVVKNGDVLALSIRNGANQPSIHESMRVVSNLVDPNLTITLGSGASGPNPTSSRLVNPDLGKEPLYGLGRYVRDRKNSVHTQIVPLTEPSVKVGLVYYTDNRLDEAIMAACQRQIEHCRNGHELVSVSLKPILFGRNIVLDAERSILTMYRQILAGLEVSTADVVFLVEHDCLYHKSHFDFMPPRKDTFFYDGNFYQVDAKTGHALTHVWRSTSGLCAYRDLLLEHYRKRVERVEREGYNVRIGHEPGTHNRPERIDDHGCESWMAEYPSIDIRHGHNLTPAKWRKEDFRSQRYTEGWQDADEVPGWGVTKGRFTELLQGV